MLHKTKSININVGLAILLICSLVSPFISRIYRGYVGFIPLITVIAFTILAGRLGNDILNNIYKVVAINKKILLSLVLFIGGVFLSYFRGANDYQYLAQIIVLPLFFFTGAFLSGNKIYRYFAVKGIFLFIFLNIYFAGRGIGSNLSARDVYADSELDLVSGTSGFWALIGIFFPLFINSFLNQKGFLKKIIYAIGLLYVLYKLMFSGFATPIALFFINILSLLLLYFFSKKRNIIHVLKAIFVFTFILITTIFTFKYLLNANFTALKAVQWRFTNFIENPSGGGYDGGAGESRIDLMYFSIKTFTNNLVFGGGGNLRTSIYEGVAGGHSSFFDFLAVLGIFGGGGAFLYFIFNSFTNSYRHMKFTSNFESKCNFSVVLSIIIGGIMNPYWSGSILMCFLLVVNFYKVKKYE